MKKESTDLPGLMTVSQDVYQDKRGYFHETYRESFLPFKWVQDNVSQSVKGVVRGLHYQLKRPQAKLVTCLFGRIIDVAVDVRRGSTCFGKYYQAILAGGTGDQLFVPEGYAHGFLVTSSVAIVHYKCSDYYCHEDARGILWDDPALGIPWELMPGVKFCLSETDAKNPPLKDAELPELKE